MLLAGCSTLSTDRSVLEYRVQKVEYNLQVDPYIALQNYLNAMSKDGWRLVQFVEIDNKFRVVMRPREEMIVWRNQALISGVSGS